MDPILLRNCNEIETTHGLTLDEIAARALEFAVVYVRGDFERFLHAQASPDRDLLSAGEVWPSQREMDDYAEYAHRERV